MNLSKAIEIATVMQKEQVYLLAPDGGDAIQLLIEAGKRYLSLKLSEEYVIIKPLPGETEK